MNLTREEIMSLEGETLRLAVAEHVMGWKWFAGLDGYEFFRREENFNYGLVRQNGKIVATYYDIPDYTNDIAAAWLAETEIERRGLTAEYMLNLAHIVGFPGMSCMMWHHLWNYQRATPEQRSRAALLAVLP